MPEIPVDTLIGAVKTRLPGLGGAVLARVCVEIVQVLNQAPDRVGVLLVRSEKGLVLVQEDKKTRSGVLPTGFISTSDRTLPEAILRVLYRISGISLPPHLITAAPFVDVPEVHQGTTVRTRYWVVQLQEGDSLLHVAHGAYKTSWIPREDLQARLAPPVRGLLPTQTLSTDPTPGLPVPAPSGGRSKSIREEISLGEPVSQARSCDIPPDVVLRSKVDHLALLRGQITPMTPSEVEASHRMFPDPAALEPVGYQLRGPRVYALTEDDRTYPVERLPQGLVLSLNPRQVRAFSAFLQALPPEVRRWRDRTLDRLVVDPQQAASLQAGLSGDPSLPPAYRGAAEHALSTLADGVQADVLERQIWQGLCYGPGGPSSPLREAWERADYGAMVAQVSPREPGALGNLVRQMARLRGISPAPLAASGVGSVRLGLPTDLITDVEAHGGTLTAALRKAYGRVQARQTILVLPEEDAQALITEVQDQVPRWQVSARDPSLTRNDRRTFSGWLERAQALVQEVPVLGPAPGFVATVGGELTEHQQGLVRTLIRRAWTSPELRGYVPDQAWREAAPAGRTFVRFQSPEGRQVVLILPPERGEATPMFAAIHPGEADTYLDVRTLVREEQARGGPSPAQGVTESLRVRGASREEDAREFAFHAGLTATPVGAAAGQVNPAWQLALMDTHAQLRRLGLPDLRPLLTPGGHTACGAFACAYVSDRLPGRVLKITGDPADAAAWAHVRDLSLSVPALARTEMVISGADPRVFVLVQPFLYALSPWERGFLRQPGMRYLLERGVGSQKVCIEAVRAYAAHHVPPRGHSEGKLAQNVLSLRQALRALNGRQVRLHDLHAGNVLRTRGGLWRLVDLGVSESPPIDIPDWDPGRVQALVRDLTRRSSSGQVERLPASPQSGLGMVPDDLYHGTGIDRMEAILREGLLPRKVTGKGSIHRTETTTATFLTDEPAGALSYALASGADRARVIILDIDPAGLDIWPDYDDTTQGVDASLEEIGRAVAGAWIPKIGEAIPGDLVDEVYSALEDLREEGVDAPLDVLEGGDGEHRIVVDPIVRMPVAEEFARLLDLADYGPSTSGCSAPDIQFDEGTPYFEIRQYQCRGSVSPSQIRGVWVDTRAFLDRGDPIPEGETLCLGDPAVSPRLPSGEIWTEDDPEEEADYFTVTLVRLSREEALTWAGRWGK